MASLFTLIRQQLQTAAQSVSPFLSTPSQVILGNYDFITAGNKDFYKNLVSTGPWLFIASTEGEVEGFGFNGDFSLPAFMFYGAPQNEPFDFTQEEDWLSTLITAWIVAIRELLPNIQFKVKWLRPKARTDLGPNVFQTEFKFTIPCVADQTEDV